MKKFIAIILVLVIVLGMCACGNKAGTSSGGNYLNADGKIQLTIGLPTNAMIMDLDNNELTKWVEEQCGVELTFQEFAGGTELGTQISAAIAARQELPDICIGVELGDKVLNRYGKDEYILDLQDYFADKEGASKIFWDRVTNELTEEQQELLLSKLADPVTGAIYSVPTIETSLVDKLDSMLWINVEWLDKLGLEKPTNTEELYKVLKAFKENDCNGDGDKTDEIPLYGSISGTCQNVVSWLLNMFGYYNMERLWMVDESGKLYMPYATDEYREGLKFINKLYKEGLLSKMVFNTVEKAITTPTSGKALCGIFAGHLTVHVQNNNELLYQYEPLEKWGYSILGDMTFHKATFITDSCDPAKVDKAFEVLMTLWSWEGSMRQRYGAYGQNWTDADPGAKSDMDLDATYKLLDDPFSKQNTVRWPKMCALNVYAECETAQTTEMTPWFAKRCANHAEQYRLHLKSAERNPVDRIAKPFTLTDEEQDEIAMVSTNVNDFRTKALTNFIRGEGGMDPNSDTSWNSYLAELDKLGYQEFLAANQKAYDRVLA